MLSFRVRPDPDHLASGPHLELHTTDGTKARKGTAGTLPGTVQPGCLRMQIPTGPSPADTPIEGLSERTADQEGGAALSESKNIPAGLWVVTETVPPLPAYLPERGMSVHLLTSRYRVVDVETRTELCLRRLHPNHEHLRFLVKVGLQSSQPALRALGLGCKPQRCRPYSIVP